MSRVPLAGSRLISGAAAFAALGELGVVSPKAGTAAPAPPPDPATVALSVWNHASYNGVPWPGTASAGGSAAVSLTASGVAPAVGSPINTFTPASFNGTSHALTMAGALSTIITPSAYTASVLAYLRGGAAANGGAYQNQQILGDSGAIWGLSWSTSGVAAWHDDGAGVVATAWIPCAANALHWIDVRFITGTPHGTLGARVDGGPWVTVSKDNVVSLGASTLRVARNYGSTYTSMDLYELQIAPSALSNATLDGDRSYGNTRYGFSL